MTNLIEYLNGLAGHFQNKQLSASEFIAHMQGAVALSQFQGDISSVDAVELSSQAHAIVDGKYKSFESPEMIAAMKAEQDIDEDYDDSHDAPRAHYGASGEIVNG